MTRSSKSRMPGPAVLLVAALAAACAPQTSQWSHVEAPRENRVTLVRMSHSVQFRANEERMSASETARLAAFIRDQNIGYGDQVLLLSGDGASAARRQESVAMVFARGGLRVVRDVQIEGVSTSPDEVRIVVGRHVVTPPECPNWSKRADDDFGNTGSSHIGCATTTNLGLMVADPRDLLIGRTMGPADGEVAATRVESYRRGIYPGLLQGDVRPNGGRKDIVKESGK
jgi:pilus assembly protein CpaD